MPLKAYIPPRMGINVNVFLGQGVSRASITFGVTYRSIKMETIHSVKEGSRIIEKEKWFGILMFLPNRDNLCICV